MGTFIGFLILTGLSMLIAKKFFFRFLTTIVGIIGYVCVYMFFPLLGWAIMVINLVAAVLSSGGEEPGRFVTVFIPD